METFTKLLGSLLALVYHCFDRIVIQGYLPLLTRPEHMVHFFRDVHGIYPLTKEVLAKRTNEYQRWVEAFARNHRIPIQWPEEDMKKKGIKKEDYVRPYCLSMERRKRFGVSFIFKSMEQGPTFRSVPWRITRPMLPFRSSSTWWPHDGNAISHLPAVTGSARPCRGSLFCAAGESIRLIAER